MSGPNRSKFRREWHCGVCDAHGKRLYATRRDAKATARQVDRSMGVYPCDEVIGCWHMGHLAPAVKAGHATRARAHRVRGA